MYGGRGNFLVVADAGNRALTLGEVFRMAVGAQRHGSAFIDRIWTRAAVGKQWNGPCKFVGTESAKDPTPNLGAKYIDCKMFSDDKWCSVEVTERPLVS